MGCSSDVGSNIGTSVAQLMSVRPDASVVCFEPSERFRDVLIRNILENGWGNVRVEALLLGAESGSMELFTNTSTASVVRRDYGGHFFIDAAALTLMRLDEYFADVERLDMIKSDTDGFEVDVLLGAEGCLSRQQPVLYFEFAPFLLHDAGRKAHDLLGYLAGHGYTDFIVFAQDGALLALTDEPSTILALADHHQYVDLFTASRPEQIAVFPSIADAARAPGPS